MKKLLILIALVYTGAAFAQRPNLDPRPLKGKVDVSKISVITDWNAFLEKARGNSLKKNAIPIATTTKTPMPLLHKDETTLAPMHSDKTKGMWKVLHADNGTVNWMWLARTKKASTQTSQSIKPEKNDPLAILQSYSRTLKLSDPKSELVLMSDERDDFGKRHVRYAQYYKGIPVWNKDLYIHFDAENEVSVINGTYEPTPTNTTLTSAIDNTTAIGTAIADLKVQNVWSPVSADVAAMIGYSEPTASLVLYPREGTTSLAYSVKLFANLYESYEYIVDATSGKIVNRLEKFCSIAPVDRSQKPISVTGISLTDKNMFRQIPQAVGFKGGNGVDLNGVNQNFRCYEHGDGKFYSIWDLPNINLAQSQLPNTIVGGSVTLTLQGKDLTQTAELFHVTSSSTTFSDNAGINAHLNAKTSYDYFVNTFGRKAIDDKNSLLISIVHATEGAQAMDNAYWTGKLMVYGDGNTAFKPLAGDLDVGGHEMTHGVIDNTAGLIYEFQSGALNESFADVFAVMIDNANLTLGEKIMQSGQGTCLRDMENPANPNGRAHQPAHMNEFKTLTADQDNGGVHINSGIPNRACALMIAALGRDKTQRVYYRALTNYLTRNSQFIDCRNACEMAAKDLNLSAADQTAVSNSFATVGIGPGVSNGDNNNVPKQTGGAERIAFLSATGQVGVIDPVTGNGGVYSNAAATARINGGFRAQLSSPKTGSSIWFVSATGRLSFIENPLLESSRVLEFPDLNLGVAGDLWNASISPDGLFVAITSAYVNDPNIYIYDISDNKIYTLPLKVETGDGTGLQTIQYADVINWSPNKNLPRVGFDAYNEESIGGTAYGYWSMYELNFESAKCYNLIPAQPVGIDVGNITYANTDPDLIAFSLQADGLSDVAIANFQTGDITELGLSDWNIDGKTITDADKPTFKPDDQFLAFSVVGSNALGFYAQPGGVPTVSKYSYQAPVYNPHWFLIGGTADVAAQEEPSSLKVKGAFPSVFDNELSISFACAKPLNIRCDLLNILGETVLIVADRKFESGEHTLSLPENNLTAGVYFVRFFAEGKDQTIKVIKK